jgi:hypothetical protein
LINNIHFILRLIVSQGLLGICTRDFVAIKSERIICQEIRQRGTVDRERIPAGRRNYDLTPSLPEKAAGFTKRSSVPIKSGLRCKPHRSTYINIRLTVRFLRALHLNIFEQP